MTLSDTFGSSHPGHCDFCCKAAAETVMREKQAIGGSLDLTGND